jgi:hypothetical protein
MVHEQGGYVPVEDDAREARARVRAKQQQPGETLSGRQARLWSAAEILDNALETLTARVVPVLLPERTSAALAGIVSDPADRSDLGGFLDQLTERLEHVGRRVSELSERIDL